ncbi:MAG: mannonate dehydratase [Bacteroidetes bacterium]|nr:mannonate dehydratase [Bacteroidota bacterium]MDA1122294.1 mannonate dehydratase [Bacteroidota bacterium]
MRLEQTMRWYGPNDLVSLSDIRQSGATGVVTALHHLKNGQVFSKDEIQERKDIIEKAGMKWSVVESIPIHEDIKRQRGKYLDYIENYKTSIRNVAAFDIKTICYNFMPVVDWTRTNLDYRLPNGASALRFDKIDFAAFEAFILKRKNVEQDYSAEEIGKAESRFKNMPESYKETITQYIIAGLPGGTTESNPTMDDFRNVLDTYADIDEEALRSNIIAFLREIIPVAEEEGVNMTIHPDDPPFSLLGLPRIVSRSEQIEKLLSAVNAKSNGLCFCTGSLGARRENDLVAMANKFANRVNFIHFRAVKIEDDGSFHEDNHLEGNVDMYAVMSVLLKEQQERNTSIPMRPDHGHKLLDDLTKDPSPGYSAIGRLKGLAELRGLELGIIRSNGWE